MLKEYSDILAVVKSVLTDSPLKIAPDFDKLFELSRKHQIIPMVYSGLYKSEEITDIPLKFENSTLRLLLHDQQQLNCIAAIENAFDAAGIDYMPLKGASLKRLYPSSEMRMMSDIDILIKEAQYTQIKEILVSHGFNELAETDHELIWKDANGIAVELHKRLIPSYNKAYSRYYNNVWDNVIASERFPHRFSMRREDEYIYLLMHIAKHYRDGGIGIRHISDIFVFKRHYPELDGEYIHRELEKTGLNRFNDNINALVDTWFYGKASTELTEHITARIIESGSYGNREKGDAAAAARANAEASSISSAKRKRLLNLIFMPYSSMKKKYSVLNRFPFLLPIMWPVRWVSAIFQHRGNVVRQYERLNSINIQTVTDYNKELEEVGLRFE